MSSLIWKELFTSFLDGGYYIRNHFLLHHGPRSKITTECHSGFVRGTLRMSHTKLKICMKTIAVVAQYSTRQLPMGAGHCQWGGLIH